ncbi:hypothetical protein [Qipengyuania intermedia]|nr:hypothetical protein [Qipengyuania intermedia]
MILLVIFLANNSESAFVQAGAGVIAIATFIALMVFAKNNS